MEEKHKGLALTVQGPQGLQEAAQHLMASRHLPRLLPWTPGCLTVTTSAGTAPWPLHCLLLISACPPELVPEWDGLFYRSPACWSFPTHPAPAFWAGCRG